MIYYDLLAMKRVLETNNDLAMLKTQENHAQ